MLGTLRRTGTTAVLVTHDQDEALAVADRIAIMRGGQIAQTADPVTLYRQPADADVARFIGAANFLPARVESRTALCVLGELPLLTDTDHCPTNMLIMIRPEQLRLTSLHTAADHAGSATGQVLSSEYHGHDTVFTVELRTDHETRVQYPGTQLTVRTHDASVRAGDLTTITVNGPAVAVPSWKSSTSLVM